MSVFVSGKSVAPLKFKVAHEPSSGTLETSAPKDNGGDGSSFSPTDLLAVSLGSCSATVAELAARKHVIPLEAVSFRVEKIMEAAPRRIGILRLQLSFKGNISKEQFSVLSEAARTCPVRLSLSPELVVEEEFSHGV